MKEIPLTSGQLLAPFFKDAYDSCPESFIQGIMGRGFTDNLEQPGFGIIQVGDFCCFGGDGQGSHKKNVISILSNHYQNASMVYVPLSPSWNQQFQENPRFKKEVRYAMDKPPITSFKEQTLSKYIRNCVYDKDYLGESVTRKYILKPIDENYYTTLQNEEWSKDFVANYEDYATFSLLGLGFVVIEGASGKVVAGASSFSTSRDSIEIQITTDIAFRGQGLATAAAARLIIECCKRGKRPSWDAANLTSVSIAQKLGYHFEEEYVAYTVQQV